MSKHLKILLTGLFVIVPFAITLWVIWAAVGWLDALGKAALRPLWNALDIQTPALDQLHGLGMVILLATVYLIGLMMHFWLFSRLVALFEAIFERVPGVKTIYESIRDLMKLFGSDSSQKMGQVVEYAPPGTELGVLGVLTNEQPDGAPEGKVAVYLPLAYMIGGPVVFAPPEHLRPVDMPVERALRLCATAQVGIDRSLPPKVARAVRRRQEDNSPPPDHPGQTP